MLSRNKRTRHSATNAGKMSAFCEKRFRTTQHFIVLIAPFYMSNALDGFFPLGEQNAPDLD